MKCPLNIRGKKTARMHLLLTVYIATVIVAVISLGSTAISTYASSETSTSLEVIPKRSAAAVDGIFTINVTVFNVIDLYAFEFKLFWNTTILDLVNFTIPEFLKPETFIAMNLTREDVPYPHIGWDTPGPGLGGCWIGVTSLAPPPGQDGSGALVILTFKVTGIGSCALDLHGTKLVDSKTELISHETVDGYFNNQDPVALFTYSPEVPDVNQIVTFDASDSYDVDGTIANYTWDFDDLNITTTTEKTITHKYATAGTYNVTLTVTDNDSRTDTTWHIVRVGRWPVAAFTYSPEIPLINETVTFNASASYDEDGWIANYTWNFDDGNITTTTEKTITHKYAAGGIYTVTLTVTDNDGLTDTHLETVKVGPPVADFTYSPETPTVGQTVTFDASDSYDAGGQIANYTWNFGDGTPAVVKTVPTTTHVYTAAGTYDVTLTVTDNDTITDTATQSIIIAKLSSSISVSASPKTVKVGENTTISGSITPKRAGVTVTIHYRLTGGTWTTLTTVTTNSNGEYSYTWTPDKAGTYEVKASWPGDANTESAESPIETITVEKAPAPIPDYMLYALVGIIVIIVAAIATYFLKIRKP